METIDVKNVDPFLANVPILNPLKTPENLWLSGVFMGFKMEILAEWVNDQLE